MYTCTYNYKKFYLTHYCIDKTNLEVTFFVTMVNECPRLLPYTLFNVIGDL